MVSADAETITFIFAPGFAVDINSPSAGWMFALAAPTTVPLVAIHQTSSLPDKRLRH